MCTRPTEDHKSNQKTLNSDGQKKKRNRTRGVSWVQRLSCAAGIWIVYIYICIWPFSLMQALNCPELLTAHSIKGHPNMIMRFVLTQKQRRIDTWDSYKYITNDEGIIYRYSCLYTSIVYVITIYYLFILIRFDRLQTGRLGFNVCLIEVQKASSSEIKTRRGPAPVAPGKSSRIYADIPSLKLTACPWKRILGRLVTTFPLGRPIFRGVAGRITLWQLCNYQISFKGTAVKGCHDVIGI